MATETKIGELVINLKTKTEALEKGLETAKQKLEQIENQNKQVQSSNNQLDASFIAMSASIVASLVKIKSTLDDSIDKYNEYVSANTGLKSVLDGQGQSFSKAQSFIEEYIKDGLIPLSNAVTAYKNLALRGYNDEQIQQVMINLKDAAAFGRQSTLEYGYAIQSATEGLKNMNPVLVDNAGVTKNMSVMYEEYATKIGKSVNSLTDEEKILAEVNGIKAETAVQTGDAAKYAETYAGQQAKANAVSIELSQTLGESLVPTYTELTKIQKNIISGLAEFISNHQSATSGIITFTTTLLAMIVGLTAAKKAYLAYKTAAAAADMTTKAFTISLMANPITLIAVGISATVAGLTIFNTKMQESIDKMNEATESSKTFTEALYNFTQNDATYTEGEVDIVTQERDKAEKIAKIYEEKNNKIIELEKKKQDVINKFNSGELAGFQKDAELNSLNTQLYNAKEALKDFKEEYLVGERTIEDYKNKVDILNKTLTINSAKQEYARVTNQKSHRETLINIAQTKADIQGKQQLLNILKQGKTTTEAYADAKSQLVKAYPELAKVNENTIASTQAAIDAENAAADAEWANAQVAIQASILEVSAMMSNSEQIQTIANATKQSVEEVTASLQNQINILSNLANLSPSDFKGSVTSTYTPKVSKSSSSYQNKALDNYKKQIEHKKALDQLSLQQEIAMYQTALNKYAKTQDEKWELTEKIYDLQKELQEKNLDDYTAMIEHRKNLDQISLQDEINMYQYAYNSLAKTTEQKQELEEKLYELRKELAQKNKELLDQQTTDYERYIEDQKKLRGAEYDTKEQEADLNKIIEIHRNYLNQIMKDERLSLEERKEIYEEELDIIKDYEQQKRDARVSSVNDIVSQLKSAITKQIEELQKADEEAIQKNIELVEEWKDTRINAINEEYNARIQAIQDEINALDKSEEEKTRAEEDAEYERKKNRLEQLISYEHDATTKANYQKEVDKLVADYQKTLDKRILSDKKDTLKEQQDLLKEEQSSKTDAIKEEAEKQKEQYETQLDNLKEYYNNQKEMAQETAEKMLLNVEQNQNQILNLLNKYGDKYEITGQSLGEKLAQGINNGIADKIQNIIQRIQDSIDAGIENKIKEWTSGIYKYEAGTNKPQTKTISITQQNYIEQNPEMPSETYRKLNNISQKLAEEFAGM